MDEEGIKFAFSKVKKDIETLKIDVLSSNQAISEQKESIESLKSKISELKELLIELKSKFSTGNEGVQSINHSAINQSHIKHSEEQVKHSQDFRQSFSNQSQGQKLATFTKVRELNEELSKTFQSLSNQEFLVFLTIYHLEDEHGRATYHEIAAKTSLTSGCIRGYVSNLLQKGAPIIKTKLKNRLICLTIDNSFRMLDLKDKLLNLYYQQDPHQTTLFSSHF